MQALPEINYPLTFPEGHTEQSLLDYLSGFRLDGSGGDELVNYLREDFLRFVYTLNLVPPASAGATLLEIGANPYFMSILLRKFSGYQLSHTNYFGADGGVADQVHRHASSGEAMTFSYANCNVDTHDIPFSQPFDTVLFCEVLEHLIVDPMQALLRIKRSLKPDGMLILTTPNVARLENVARLMAGENIYDPYSGYGPYGRHNREYSRHELFLLLDHCGFELESVFSSDVHTNRSENYFPVPLLTLALSSIQNRQWDLGQYIFLRARNARPARAGKPRWLFRSCPESEMAAGT